MPSAAILTGGRARRYGGRDKGTIQIDGRSILDRQLDVLAELTDDILLVGGPAAAVSRRGVRHVPDRVAGCGPLGGLDAALHAARDPELLLVACDMPFITVSLLRRLLSGTDGADAVVPRTERGYHPLCAAYTRACCEPVTRRLADGILAMRGLLKDVRTQTVEPGELGTPGDVRRLLANVNTPGDLRDLEALLIHTEQS